MLKLKRHQYLNEIRIWLHLLCHDVKQSLQISSEPLRVKFGISTEFSLRNPPSLLPQFYSPSSANTAIDANAYMNPQCCPTTHETSTAKQKSWYTVGSFFNSSPLSYHRIAFVLRLFWLTFLAPIQWSESPGQHAFSYLCSPVATTTAHTV